MRDYLLKNPELLQEVMVELEKRQAETQRVAQASALKDNRQTLLNAPHSIVAGNPQGDVTLVEFFDYNCGYCKRALADVQQLVKADPKLRLVMKDFPVLGPDSVEASRVALAVKNQLQGDKLFDYHVKLMETRGRVNGERALAVAKEMGLDMARLQKDMDAPEVRAALQENVGLGDKLGLTGTPAFIVGERDHARRGRYRAAEAGRRERAAVRQGDLLRRRRRSRAHRRTPCHSGRARVRARRGGPKAGHAAVRQVRGVERPLRRAAPSAVACTFALILRAASASRRRLRRAPETVPFPLTAFRLRGRSAAGRRASGGTRRRPGCRPALEMLKPEPHGQGQPRSIRIWCASWRT